jgi:hypothetical protein
MQGFLFWRLAAQIIALNLDRYATHKFVRVRAGGVGHARNHFRPVCVLELAPWLPTLPSPSIAEVTATTKL